MIETKFDGSKRFLWKSESSNLLVHRGIQTDDFQTDELQNWRAIFGEVLLTFSPIPIPQAILNPDFDQKIFRNF